MTIETPPARRRGRDTVTALAIIGAFVLALVVMRVAVFQAFSVPSAAMDPTVQEGDTVLGSKSAYRAGAPRRGDLVALTLATPQRVTYLKRIVGLPGDRIQMRGGQLYVNARPVPRTHLEDVTETTPYGAAHTVGRYREVLDGHSYLTNDFGPDGDWDNTEVYVVPPQSYFTLGDNRDNSSDSRIPPEQGGIGYVPAASLVARIDWVLYSPKRNRAFFRP